MNVPLILKDLLYFLNSSRMFQITLTLLTMDTQVPMNFSIITQLKGEAVRLGLYEAFLEAAPQFILQLSIILRTGIISKSE